MNKGDSKVWQVRKRGKGYAHPRVGSEKGRLSQGGRYRVVGVTRRTVAHWRRHVSWTGRVVTPRRVCQRQQRRWGLTARWRVQRLPWGGSVRRFRRAKQRHRALVERRLRLTVVSRRQPHRYHQRLRPFRRFFWGYGGFAAGGRFERTLRYGRARDNRLALLRRRHSPGGGRRGRIRLLWGRRFFQRYLYPQLRRRKWLTAHFQRFQRRAKGRLVRFQAAHETCLPIFLHRIGFVPTLTLARFLIQQGCILVNEQVVADVRYCVRVGECVRLDLVRYQAHWKRVGRSRRGYDKRTGKDLLTFRLKGREIRTAAEGAARARRQQVATTWSALAQAEQRSARKAAKRSGKALGKKKSLPHFAHLFRQSPRPLLRPLPPGAWEDIDHFPEPPLPPRPKFPVSINEHLRSLPGRETARNYPSYLHLDYDIFAAILLRLPPVRRGRHARSGGARGEQLVRARLQNFRRLQ